MFNVLEEEVVNFLASWGPNARSELVLSPERGNSVAY